jgi:hypothetical protein
MMMESTPPATAAKTGAPAAPATPPPGQDFSTPYGKILAPNDQAPYPFKLAMPGPGFGEVKVPSSTELAMREKLEKLAMLTDAEIRDQLQQWPAYSKMSLGDQGAMLTKIQQFRDRRDKMAMLKAHQLGLLTLNPQQQAKFEQEFWDRRLQLDRQLAQQFQGAYHNAEQKMNEDLYREFSMPAKPPRPNSLPPAPAPMMAPSVAAP